jgi:L-arabinose isomerase
MAEGGKLRVGLFGIGLEAYWSQFDGLEDRLRGYVARVGQKIAGPGLRDLNFGLVDSVERAYAVTDAAAEVGGMVVLG